MNENTNKHGLKLAWMVFDIENPFYVILGIEIDFNGRWTSTKAPHVVATSYFVLRKLDWHCCQHLGQLIIKCGK